MFATALGIDRPRERRILAQSLPGLGELEDYRPSDLCDERTQLANTNAIATTIAQAVPIFIIPAASCWSLTGDVKPIGGAGS